MPRTYSFDHFQALKPDASQRGRPQRKPHPMSKPLPPGRGLHYGRAFAQTEELYHAHEMEHQLEELVRQDAGVELAEEEKISRPQPRRKKAAPKPEALPAYKGTPIGALPQTEEVHPASLFQDALDDAGRHARALVSSAQDLLNAGWRLLLLPMDLVKLAAQRFKLPGAATA